MDGCNSSGFHQEGYCYEARKLNKFSWAVLIRIRVQMFVFRGSMIESPVLSHKQYANKNCVPRRKQN